MQGGYGETPPRGTKIDWELLIRRIRMATFQPTKIEFHTCSQHELLMAYDATNHAWTQTYRVSDPRRWDQRRMYANRRDCEALERSCDQMTLEMLRSLSILDEDPQTHQADTRKCKNCFMGASACRKRTTKQTKDQHARSPPCKETKRGYSCHSRQHRQVNCPERIQEKLCQKCGAADHAAERCESRPCRWCGQYQRCMDTSNTRMRETATVGTECWTHQAPHEIDFSPHTGKGAQVAILDHIHMWETITRREITREWREECWRDLVAVYLHTMAHLNYEEAYNDLCRSWDQAINTPVQ